MDKTIGHLFQQIQKQSPNNPLIHDFIYDQTYSYYEFYEIIQDLSKYFTTLGIRKGTHVGILMENGTPWLATFLSICNIGGVTVLLNTMLSSEELLYQVDFAHVDFLFTSETFYQKIQHSKCKVFTLQSNHLNDSVIQNWLQIGRNIPDPTLLEFTSLVRSSDIATLQFTSGTTGHPKAVEISHENVCFNAQVTTDTLQYDTRDRILLAAPLYHIFGYIGTALPAMLAGASLCCIEKFKTSTALQAIQHKQCTSFHGVPVMYQYLLNQCSRYDLSSLNKGSVAGTVCQDSLVHNIFSNLGLHKIVNFYGQTEAILIGAQTYSKHQKHKCGYTIHPWVTHKILDLSGNEISETNQIGFLYIKSPNLMKGYYKNQEQTKKSFQNGWLCTGDLVVRKEDGTIQVIGRNGDIINRGGENISTFEIEKKLMDYPGVKEAVVLGVHDEVYGEEIAAFIRYESQNRIHEYNFKTYIKERFPKIERPKYITFVDSLPYTASGKIQKYKLLELLDIKKERNEDYEI